jgi:glycine/D-amino acid oxidase-like deaminating enzyme
MNVLRYQEDEDEVKVFTDRDLTFYAARVLLCTNAFTPGIVPSIDIIPNRGQVLLTEPIEGLSWKGTFHFQRGFYYFRNLGDRILLGGARNIAFEEEQTLSFSTTSSIQSALEDFIRVHLLPEKPFTISDRWSGIMGMGSEKSPIVSALSRKVYCCVRMSGMGVALAPIVAKEAALLVSRSITS